MDKVSQRCREGMIKQRQFICSRTIRIYLLCLITSIANLVLILASGRVYAQQVSPATKLAPKPLNWTEPLTSRIQLAASASIANNIITYAIYPTNVTKEPVWDLQVRIPIPEGANFLSANGSPLFITSFDGRTVSFSAVKLAAQTDIAPLRFQISVEHVTTPLIVTRASASWKYVKINLGESIFGQEETKIADIIIQPHIVQQVVSDVAGDVPFTNYDLTGIALQQEQSVLKINFSTVGNLGSPSERLEYDLYIDNDCKTTTGRQKNGLGSEYRVRFRYDKGLADLSQWEAAAPLTGTVSMTDTEIVTDAIIYSDTVTGKVGSWRNIASVSVSSPAAGHLVTVWVPYTLLNNDQQFCWYAEASNKTDAFVPKPPTDEVPDTNNNLSLMQYNASITITKILMNESLTGTVAYAGNDAGDIPLTTTAASSVTQPLSSGMNGKLAIPLENAQGGYDVHIFSLPKGQEIAKIANASQPNFRFDGQRLLMNRKDAKVDGIFEYDLTSGTEVKLDGVISNSHSFYDPRGLSMISQNSVLAPAGNGDDPTSEKTSGASGLFTQCDLSPFRQGSAPRCRNTPNLSTLAATGQITNVIGLYPVWTATDMVVYQGCISRSQTDHCGLFMMGSRAGQNGGNEPFLRQLTNNTNDIPTDTKENVITFMSRGTADWEVYAMYLNGAWIKNLSTDQNAQDGFPAISPDGKSVAFISNRDGKWAVWVAPIDDSPVQKLFDLPDGIQWKADDQAWKDRRISWAP